MLYRIPALLLASLLLVALSACSDDESTPATTAIPTDSQESETIPSESTTSTLPTDGIGGTSTSSSTPTLPTETGTSSSSTETCGDIPILGPQGVTVNEACEACIDERCCDERGACTDDSTCADKRECYAACDGDSVCNENCFTTFGSSSLSGDFVSCRAGTCGAFCAATECIGSVDWPEPTVDDYELSMLFADFQTGAPIADATIMVCDKHTDRECDSPLQETTTDSEGMADLTLPSANDGISAFIAFDAPGYVGSDLWFAAVDPETYLTEGDLTWNIVSDATVAQITGVLGVTADATRGIVSFIATDCTRTGVAGVEIAADTMDATTTRFYLDGAFPRTTARTYSGGAGAFVNLPAGEAELTMTGPEDTVWGRITVNLRAGRAIGTNLVPTPL